MVIFIFKQKHIINNLTFANFAHVQNAADMFSFVQRIYNKFKWSPPLFLMVVNTRLLIYKDKYIVYSLGNFVFGGNQNPRDKDTMIFQIDYK